MSELIFTCVVMEDELQKNVQDSCHSACRSRVLCIGDTRRLATQDARSPNVGGKHAFIGTMCN